VLAKQTPRYGTYIYLSAYGSAVRFLDLGCFFSFLILYTVGRIPCTGEQPVARPLPTHRTRQTQNKSTHIHALSRIRTHDPRVRASEDSPRLRPRDHMGHMYTYIKQTVTFKKINFIINHFISHDLETDKNMKILGRLTVFGESYSWIISTLQSWCIFLTVYAVLTS
jgi:hypothetical protein